MKHAFLFSFLLMASARSFACQMQIDENYSKNLLIAHAASNKGVSLASVKDLAISQYSYSVSTGEANGDCPDYVYNTAKVSFKYSTVFKICTYSVTVLESDYSGSGIPDGPIMDVSFSNESQSCVRKPIIIRPH